MLDLYHWEPNGFSLKALVALNEKELDYTSHYVDWLADPMRRPTTLNLEAELNPEIEGPILVHDEAVITETFFMMAYLDDAFPRTKPLHPADPYTVWQIQAWGRYMGERAAPAISTLGNDKFTSPAFQRSGAGSIDLAAIEPIERRTIWTQVVEGSAGAELLGQSRRRVGLAIDRIERTLTGADWLVADIFSAADIDAFALANSLPKLVPELCNPTATPQMTAWLDRMRARPSVVAALARARTEQPELAFAPGPEHNRWG